jgi:lambda family phage tail tape measure protein
MQNTTTTRLIWKNVAEMAGRGGGGFQPFGVTIIVMMGAMVMAMAMVTLVPVLVSLVATAAAAAAAAAAATAAVAVAVAVAVTALHSSFHQEVATLQKKSLKALTLRAVALSSLTSLVKCPISPHLRQAPLQSARKSDRERRRK